MEEGQPELKLCGRCGGPLGEEWECQNPAPSPMTKSELWIIGAIADARCRSEDAKLGFSFAEEIIQEIRAKTFEEVAAKLFPEKIRRINDAIQQRLAVLRSEGECVKREIARTEGRNH